VIPLVAVVGPTASGKTAMAVELAEFLDTEIISADSMQFYRGMEIGTGAPSPEELKRVKHHFIGHLTPNQEMSAADFQENGRKIVRELNDRGKTAVVVGGSGLYIQALIDGLFEGPGKNQDVRDQLVEEADETGVEGLYGRLKEADPNYADRIASTDLRRIVRALEVFELTGTPFSELHQTHRDVTPSIESMQFALAWPRDILYERVNKRVDQMLEDGLLDEISKLVEQGYGADIHRLKSLGYREMLSHVEGTQSLEEAAEKMKMFTRRYAKRQTTWFNGDSRVEWLETDPDKTVLFHLKQLRHRLETNAEA
jgi:tRNA dimethylallyltransferase